MERRIQFRTNEGNDHKIMLLEADIGKVLISVTRLVENENDVQMCKRNPHIRNLRTGMVTKLKRKR